MKSIRNSDPFSLSGGARSRSYYVRPSKKHRWGEIDQSAEGGSSNKDVSPVLNISILNLWIFVIITGISLLFARTAYLQIGQGDFYSKIADGNRIRIRDIKASRGIIYDRSKNVLVENIASFSLAFVPVDLPDDEQQLNKIIFELSKFSSKPESEIKELVARQSPYSYQAVIVKENLSHDEAIMAQILNSTYPGIILKSESIRNYIHSGEVNSLSHVLGYEGRIEESRLQEYLDKGYSYDDRVGKTGIELQYETELKGVNGKEQVEVDATGSAKEIISSQKPIEGENLVLTLDIGLQKKAEEALEATLQQYNKQRGAVVVMDPRNGEVLALVSYPGFDNNIFSKGISQENYQQLISDENRPLFSRAVSGSYPSGSTFKLVVASAALEEGIVNENTYFNSVGGLSVGAWFFPDWKAGGHGRTNVVKALSDSVNTFFYYVSGGYGDFKGMGADKITEYAYKLGFNKKTDIDLPAEGEGFIPSPKWKVEAKNERWYIGDTYNFSIGQGDVLVTPLQIALATSLFANNGTSYKPHVVKEILDFENNVITSVESEVHLQNVISYETVQLVRKGLRQGVESGSGARLSLLPISAASKTGTAQWSSTKAPHAWMTAFAPFENPEIVVTVLIEEGEEGSRTATQTAYEILKWWADNRYATQPK